MSLLNPKPDTCAVAGDKCTRNLYRHVNAPVPLRPVVLRFIPEPPGSWTGMNRVKMTFFAEKSRRSTVEALKHPGSTPVHPGRAPAGPRFIPALTRFTQLHAGRTPVTLRFFPVLHGGATVLPGSPRFIPAR